MIIGPTLYTGYQKMLVYSRKILISMRNCWKSCYELESGNRLMHRPLSCYVWEKLKFYNLPSPARGQRGGNHLRRANEKAINTIKPFVRRQNVIAKQRGINSANLLNIQTSILNINYNSGIVEAGQNNNVFHNGYNKLLPRFCLMNVRSLLPKIDELCSFNLNVEWRSDFFHSVRCLLAKRFVSCHTQGGIGNFTYFLEEQNQFALNLSVRSMPNITSLKVVWPNFSCEFLLTLFTPMDFISPYYEVL